jgi:acyl-CoA thioester hydrolase
MNDLTVGKPPGLRQQNYPQWTSERVRFSDTDLVGHVNNLAFCAYLETGRSMFLRQLTQPAAGPRSLFVLADLSMRFLGEAHWPDEIRIGTGISAIGRSSVQLAQGLYVGDRCISTANSVLVLIDESTRRSREIPQSIRDWLETLRIPAI